MARSRREHGPRRPKRQSDRLIVIVTNQLTMGGAEKQIITLAPALLEAGFRLHVLSILPTAAHQEEVERLGIPVTHLRLLPGLRGASAILGAAKVLRNLQPEVVVSFVYQANVLGRIAGRLSGAPVIVSSIRGEFFGRRWRDWLLRATDRLCTLTTTNSDLVANSLIKRNVVPAGRLHVIRNGIDVASYETGSAERSAAREELGATDDDFVWLFIGKFHRQKDIPNLLEAFERHARGHASARLCIVGDGALRPMLEQQVRELSPGGRVAFLGTRTDIARLLAGADALVLSSAWEGLPNVVMEAMAASKPVVATSVGGVPELVGDGVTGFLVPPADPVTLASAMGRLVALDPPARAAMGRRAHASILEGFSLDASSKRWLALINSCVENETARR